jgi:hypothetical protein
MPDTESSNSLKIEVYIAGSTTRKIEVREQKGNTVISFYSDLRRDIETKLYTDSFWYPMIVSPSCSFLLSKGAPIGKAFSWKSPFTSEKYNIVGTITIDNPYHTDLHLDPQEPYPVEGHWHEVIKPNPSQDEIFHVLQVILNTIDRTYSNEKTRAICAKENISVLSHDENRLIASQLQEAQKAGCKNIRVGSGLNLQLGSANPQNPYCFIANGPPYLPEYSYRTQITYNMFIHSNRNVRKGMLNITYPLIVLLLLISASQLAKKAVTKTYSLLWPKPPKNERLEHSQPEERQAKKLS